MNEVVVNPVEFGLEVKQAENITNGLKVTLAERVALIDTYEDVISMEITKENLKTFKDLRLLIVKNRTQGLTKWKITEKAFYLAGGNFVQAIYNKEVAINEAMELKLSKAEKHFENLEKERLENLQFERINKINNYVEDAHLVDYSLMDEDFFNDYLQLKKTKFEKEKAEKLAEEKRIEDARLKEVERLKVIELENAKLKKEAEERERLAKIESEKRAKAESERIAKETKEREQREAIAAKEKSKQDAILLKEREAKAKLEQELKAQKESELKAKKLAADLKEKERLENLEKEKAPLKEKMSIWINDLTCGTPPELNEITTDIINKFESFKNWAKQEIKKS